jgi:uncharacterized protein YdbL (DUF1318 family)
MKWKPPLTLTSLLSLFLVASAAAAFADAGAIKQRMLQRLPVIESLKAQGIVGENNKGYLEFVGNKRAREDVVAAENADRRQVYTAIAGQQGASVEVVGVHRAAQLAQSAAPGTWLQDANGRWYRK